MMVRFIWATLFALILLLAYQFYFNDVRTFIWMTLFVLILLLASHFYARDLQILLGAKRFRDLFRPDKIAANFREVSDQYPCVTIARDGPVLPLEEAPQNLPGEYLYEGQTRSIEDWIERTQTTGLVILKNGKLVHERYLRGNSADSRPITFSVSKSVVSFLIGTALDDGDIRSLDDPVDEYVPLLKSGGYRGIRIKDVLQMSSGIYWNENYGNLFSEVVRSVGVMLAGDLNQFVATLKPDQTHKPGTYLQYKSADTHVLGMVLEAATGTPFHLYASRKLWSQLGAEDDARLMVDAEGNPVVMGGICMRVRDMARFGQLYLDDGRNLQGDELLKDKNWIKDSTALDPTAAHLQPASTHPDYHKKVKKYPFGYAHHWWIPDPPQGDFSAVGIYGQFIYVSPRHRVVIAKTSAFFDYTDQPADYAQSKLFVGDEMEIESMSAFRSIAAGLM